ncbi:S66 peptidase family protein [Puia dinghuensis]|uniref:Peptidase S66 n=1 Tax=Puia dinghuensis TaxID=1792502 RepID=A0A8J2UEW5_9BACT|nr:LD-carboxypeptidase [Puia dinghuensis]GGB05719.1 peptidase S66 [Puia dinghuensis]
MNRKNFLSSLLTIGAAGPVLAAPMAGKAAPPAPMPAGAKVATPLVIPPYLRPGDTIGITCPAGDITALEILPATQLIESWGFRIKVGDTVGKKDAIFGGTDAERAADFQQMLNDREVSAILCARGGYGAVHIIDQLDFTPLATHPKWIIGFSDITVILCHIHTNGNIASIHSKMCNSFPDDWSKAEPGQAASILSIRQALSGERMQYNVAPNSQNRTGRAEGTLIGGNLKTIETLAGTHSDIYTAGKILFVEDTGEYLYSIDRMFWHLQRSGKLNRLAGLVVGGFKVKPDDPGEEFKRTVADIVMDRVRSYDYPVCFDFPVGHQKDNFALKYGIPHLLDVQEQQVSLTDTSITGSTASPAQS